MLLNDDRKSTFVRRNGRSIVDLSYASSCLAHNVAWEVSESYTQSDHQSICMELKKQETGAQNHLEERLASK